MRRAARCIRPGSLPWFRLNSAARWCSGKDRTARARIAKDGAATGKTGARADVPEEGQTARDRRPCGRVACGRPGGKSLNS
jgi:hypothetical protein